MKQKIIIGFSLIMLIVAVYLIARDLFRHSPSFTITSCCGDQDASLKAFDTTLLGYTRVSVFETGLHNLTGIAVSEDQQVFVCGNREVAIYNREGKRTGGFGTDSATNCIALYQQNVYVGMGPCIVHYHTDGTLIDIWEPLNNKGYITSIAANNEWIYAADGMNKRILRYVSGGDLVQEIGRKDSTTGAPGFIIPSLYFDISAGGFNDFWVVNPGRLEIENYTSSGILRSAWGKASFEDNGFTGCCNPAHMAMLPDGNFVTYEKGIDKIKVFDPAGQFSCMVAGAGSFKGSADFKQGKNNLVKDMTTDAGGRIYILDAYNNVNIFKKTEKQATDL